MVATQLAFDQTEYANPAGSGATRMIAKGSGFCIGFDKHKTGRATLSAWLRRWRENLAMKRSPAE